MTGVTLAPLLNHNGHKEPARKLYDSYRTVTEV
jgi:hypothetical protein